MRVTNPKLRPTNTPDIALLKAHLAQGNSETFDELRVSIPAFANYADGEIHQIALDAGFEVG